MPFRDKPEHEPDCSPPASNPPCRQCHWHTADEDGFCSDACYHLYQEELRKGGVPDGRN